jgi:sugar porter (SP) family MFS transporter
MKLPLLLPTIIAGLGGVLVGYDITIIRIAIPFLTSEFRLYDALQDKVMISSIAGCATGALVIGRQADFYGRRSILMALSFFFLISAVGTGVVNNPTLLILFQFIAGIAVGGLSVVTPIYLSEISPPHLRGRVVSVFHLAIVSGMLLAVWSDYLTMSKGVNNWRYMFIGGGFPAIICILLIFLIPESPRWLMQKGQERVARFIIRQMRPVGDMDQIVREIKESINIEIMAAHTYLFRKPYLKLVLTGIVIGILTQLTGIAAIMHYAPDILKSAGLSSVSYNVPLMIIGLTCIVATIIAMYFIDKTGRKKLLMVGSIGIAVSLSLIAIVNFTGLKTNYILSLLLIGFIGFFFVSQGTVIWVYLSELFPYNIRTRGASLGLSSFWLSNLIIWYFFQRMEVSPGIGIGIVFALFALVTFGSYFFFRNFLIETKGQSLEELERQIMKEKAGGED